MITIGARVGRHRTSASWASAIAWNKKIATVRARWPKRATMGPKTRRAGSCMAPIHPIIAAARVGE